MPADRRVWQGKILSGIKQRDHFLAMRAGNILPERMVGKFKVSIAGRAGHLHISALLQGQDCLAMRAGDFFTQTVAGKFNVATAGSAGYF